MNEKLKELPLFDPATDSNPKNIMWSSVYQSGTEGASGTYESKRIREQNIDIFNYTEVAISSAEILTCGTIPVQLLAGPGVGKYYSGKMVLEYDHDTTPYNCPVDLAINGCGDQYISKYLISLSNSQVCIVNLGQNTYIDAGAEYIYSNPLGINEAVKITTYDNSNPTLGDGTLLVKIWYKIETFGTNI